jgi:hypothetical protein
VNDRRTPSLITGEVDGGPERNEVYADGRRVGVHVKNAINVMMEDLSKDDRKSVE